MPVTRLPTAQEQQEATEAYLHGLYGLGIGAASQAVPPVAAGADKGDWKSWVPGIGSYLYEQGAGLLGTLATGAGTFGSLDPDSPTVKIPGVEAARRMNEAAVDAAKKILPSYEAKTEPAKMGEDIGVGMGQGATAVAPEAGLPKFLSVPLHVVAPPASTAPIGAALGGTVSAFKPEEAAATEQKPTEQPVVAAEQPPVQVAKNEVRSPFAPVTLSDAPTSSPYAGVNLSAPAPSNLRPSITNLGLSSDNDTGWSYGQWGAATLAAGVGAWIATKAGPRTLNVISDVIRGQTRDVGEATQLLHPSPGATPTGVIPKPVEMPLPNDASGLSRRIATSEYNPNAVVNELVKSPLVSPTSELQAERVAANEMINNPANAQRRMEGLFRTGVEDGTGHAFPSVVDYKNQTEALSYEQKAIANQLAWDRNELDLREAKQRAASKTTPVSQDDPSLRVGQVDTTTTDLRARIARAEADPEVLAWYQAHNAIPTAIADSLLARGYITPAEHTFATTVRPNYMPTISRDGNLIRQWDVGLPATGSGADLQPTTAWEAMIKHFDSTIKGAQHNDWQASIIKYIEDAQRTNPGKVGEIVTPRDAPGASRRSITIRTATGPKHYDINNTALFSNLTQGPATLKRAAAIANTARRYYQNVTTGLGAAAVGHPFALKNFLRDTVLIPAQAQKGLWRGQLDKSLGVRLPYDPTFIAGSAATLGRDASTVTIKHLADMLASSTHPLSAWARGSFGPAKVDAMVSWMRNRVDQSRLAAREAQGVGAGGNRAVMEMNNFVQNKPGTYRDPTGSSVAPLINRPNFGRIPTSIPMPNYSRSAIQNGVRGAAESVINLNSLAKELYGVISDAPHSYLHDVNIGNPKFPGRTLASAVQEVTGNPGTRGTGWLSSGFGGGLPYYNTSVQALGRSLAAFRDHPLQVGATVATVLGSYALAEHLSALISGKDHVNHLEQQTSNSSKARNAIIYHGPGTDPNDHTEIPIPNEWQVLHPYISGLAGHMLGSWTAHQSDDTLSRLVHTIADAFSAHVETDVLKQQGIGAVSAAPPVGLNPLTGVAVAATTGAAPKNPLDVIVGNAISGKPLLGGMASSTVQQHKLPGQEGSDGVLLRSDSGVMHAIMSQLGAGTAAAWDMATNFANRAKVDSQWAWSGLVEDYKQEWKDNTQFMNSVWRNNLPQSTFGSLEERTNQMWHNIASASNLSSDLRGEGFSGVGKKITPMLVTGESPIPKDPLMFQLYTQVAAQAKLIEKSIMPQENLIRSQMDNLKSAPFMPQERRRIQNELSQKLYDITAQKHQMLLDLNARLSHMTGGRHVDVGSKINWQGTVDQFHY